MGRGVIIALVASLALNVFGAGFITARIMSDERTSLQAQPGSPAGQRGLDDPFRLMRRAEILPSESREAFRAAFRDELPSLRARHQEIRRLRRELGILLTGETWNEEEIAEAMAAINSVELQQRQAFSAAFMKAFSTLTVEERRLLIRANEERRRLRQERRRPRP